MAHRAFEDWIAGLPKTETHLHIEGALPWGCVVELDPAMAEFRPQSWNPDYRFAGFDQFESELLGAAAPWFQSVERYYEAARRIFRRLFEEESVRYVETSFASGVVEAVGLDGAAVAEAIAGAAPEGMVVRVFMGIHHNGYTERSAAFIEECVHWPHLAGVDLHGTETLPLEDWTPRIWENARKAGKLTKAHAGEFCGPEFIREVVDKLGVTRIQHGVRAIGEKGFPEWLAERGVTLDMCPISNLKLGPVKSLDEYPIRLFQEAGLRCTVNTDDPLSFGNRLRDDFTALWLAGACEPADLIHCIRAGFQGALVAEDQKKVWLKELEGALEGNPPPSKDV